MESSQTSYLMQRVIPLLIRELGPQISKRVGPVMAEKVGIPLAKKVGLPLVRKIGVPIARKTFTVILRKIDSPLINKIFFNNPANVLTPTSTTAKALPKSNAIPKSKSKKVKKEKKDLKDLLLSRKRNKRFFKRNSTRSFIPSNPHSTTSFPPVSQQVPPQVPSQEQTPRDSQQGPRVTAPNPNNFFPQNYHSSLFGRRRQW